MQNIILITSDALAKYEGSKKKKQKHWAANFYIVS